LNTYRKITLIIVFLLVVTSVVSISSTSSALLLSDIITSNGEGGESFEVLVMVAGVRGNCGQEVKITLANKSETFELCEGDERPLEEQRADPISSQGYQFKFPKGQFAVGEYFDVCVEISDSLSDCKILIKLQSNQPEEQVTFIID
jgi:hypothetical protein